MKIISLTYKKYLDYLKKTMYLFHSMPSREIMNAGLAFVEDIELMFDPKDQCFAKSLRLMTFEEYFENREKVEKFIDENYPK